MKEIYTDLERKIDNNILEFFKWYCNYKNNINEGKEEEIIEEWLNSK